MMGCKTIKNIKHKNSLRQKSSKLEPILERKEVDSKLIVLSPKSRKDTTNNLQKQSFQTRMLKINKSRERK